MYLLDENIEVLGAFCMGQKYRFFVCFFIKFGEPLMLEDLVYFGSFLGVLMKEPFEESFAGNGQMAKLLSIIVDLFLDCVFDDQFWLRRSKGKALGKTVVNDHPKGEQVRGVVLRLPLVNLRSDKVGGPASTVQLGEVLLEIREPKID